MTTQPPSPPEPQFDIIAEDTMEAMRVGQMVQELEIDATVRQHPFCPPGYAIVINRAAFGRFACLAAGGGTTGGDHA